MPCSLQIPSKASKYPGTGSNRPPSPCIVSNTIHATSSAGTYLSNISLSGAKYSSTVFALGCSNRPL